jgi:hypothetical protein
MNDAPASIDIAIGSYDEVQDEVNRKLEPGWYNFTVDALPEVRYSQKNNDPYLAWRLKVVGADDPADNNFTIFHNTMLAGKGKGMFVRFCEAFGHRWEGSSVTTDFLEEFIAQEVRGEVIHTSRTLDSGDVMENCEIKRFAPAE